MDVNLVSSSKKNTHGGCFCTGYSGDRFNLTGREVGRVLNEELRNFKCSASCDDEIMEYRRTET
jgi:hypothetical protein